jgi:DNA-binding CsgD family transcriptional regulator
MRIKMATTPIKKTAKAKTPPKPKATAKPKSQATVKETGPKKNGRQGEGGGNTEIVLTEAQKAEVRTLASVLNTEQIADYLGIGRTTFFEIMKRDQEVAELYRKGTASAIGTVAKSLIQKARDGNVQAMKFYLSTQAGWKERSQVDHVSSDGTMSNAELTHDQLAQQLKDRGIDPLTLIEK